MTFITWTCLRCVQELATILGPQNPTQRSCELLSLLTQSRLTTAPCYIAIYIATRGEISSWFSCSSAIWSALKCLPAHPFRIWSINIFSKYKYNFQHINLIWKLYQKIKCNIYCLNLVDLWQITSSKVWCLTWNWCVWALFHLILAQAILLLIIKVICQDLF